MAYQPIEDYGLIGDMQTVALVGKNGAIDWFCFPYFDSPSVFGAILDDRKGGCFKIAPVDKDGLLSKQFYWPDTNVLATRFFSSDGVGELLDFMPVDRAGKARENRLLIRKVSALRGAVTFRMECSPAFNYAREKHEVSISGNSAIFNTESLGLQLSATCPLKRDDNGIISEFTLDEGETAYFVLSGILPETEAEGEITEEGIEALFDETVRYWHQWISRCKYTAPITPNVTLSISLKREKQRLFFELHSDERTYSSGIIDYA